jgi:hypothetical protein
VNAQISAVFLNAFVDPQGRPTFLGYTVCQLSGMLKVAGEVEARAGAGGVLLGRVLSR